ncbi:hypothetical protein C8P63_10848 [Melghirimyces profundicolus]|uniref:DUF402 domain-containing protein n=1 Tax=Melghirimyces profundicolus TaxID=1242148 RepID=A0A2T6BXD3_9BACL|nr:DUF402 domain-containing protein [Melghirimyces profundicolus]PTX60739.1 hypothetical protein C8P63_10848 [Melghirimyces profundicolus]
MVQPKDHIRIISRKHDGSFHRSWERSVVLTVGSSLRVANRDVKVTESDGRTWISEGLAVCQFHRNKWFNTILLFSPEGSHRFYCNLASPFEMEDGNLVYIDYDLDLLVEPGGNFRWLDWDEFLKNRRLYGYPSDVVKKVLDAASELEYRAENGKEPFTPGFVENSYYLYLSYANQVNGVK